MVAAVRARGSVRAGSARGSVGAPQAYDDAIRAQLADLQRARILSAMFEVAVERGAASVTVAHVVERSGVSRRTFYDVFEDREDCFLAAFEQALELVSERVLPTYRSEPGWRKRIRAALGALLRFLDEEPVVGRLLIVESSAGGGKSLARRNEVIAQVRRAIDAGREEVGASSPAPVVAEGIVGGVLAVVHARLAVGERGPLIELLNPLMSMIVLPYAGSAASRRELDGSLPPLSRSACAVAPLVADPFKGSGTRLTYRTVRVLSAVRDNEGSSNRAIGEAAGMSDQGQISKLLSRLERIGLIANAELGPGLGAPNAWTLTDRGRQIAETVRERTPEEGGARR